MLLFELAKKYCDSVDEKLIFLYLLTMFPAYRTIDEISEDVGMLNISVSHTLKSMVAEGYVERKQLNPPTAEGPLYGYGVVL